MGVPPSATVAAELVRNSRPHLASGQDESTALPDLSRIATQVTAKARVRAGAQHRGFHVRSFAILFRRFCTCCGSLDVISVFGPIFRILQCRSRDSLCAHFCGSRGSEVLVAARQVDRRRPALGLSGGRPAQMLVRGRRRDGDGEEAASASRRRISCRYGRREKVRSVQAEDGGGCARGAAALRTRGYDSAEPVCARAGGWCRSRRCDRDRDPHVADLPFRARRPAHA